MGYWENFKLAGGTAFKLLMPLLLKFLKDNGPALIEIALKVIPLIAMSIAAGDATGADAGKEKREAAFNRIMEEAKAQGFTPKDHEIYAAIEIAVGICKEEKRC